MKLQNSISVSRLACAALVPGLLVASQALAHGVAAGDANFLERISGARRGRCAHH